MRFYVPTDLRIADGCVASSADALRRLGSVCLLVTGKHAAAVSGALGDVCQALDAEGIRYRQYDGIARNPTVASCREAGLLAAQCGAQFIIGIGGGSPLDAAKAAAVFAANPTLTTEALYAYRWGNAPLPTVCVGTTAGTGSEVTPVSVLTTDAGRKQSIRDDRLYPALSLGDAKYTHTLSERETCSCAADAAAHCIESFFSKKATDISRLFAVRGAAMLLPLFRTLCAGGVRALTAQDRQTLYVASIYGGYAISVTGTAFPHAMGYFLSEQYNVPHGTACAVYLPTFLRHADACVTSDVQAFCTRTGGSIEEWTSHIRGVTPTCNVRLTDAQIDALRPRFTDNSGLARSPGHMTADDALQILRDLFGETDGASSHD